MRLYPPVTTEEAKAWLTAQAVATWGPAKTSELGSDLETLAEAMSLISAVELPDELEPLFP